MTGSSLWAEALAILRKDVRSELRTRAAVFTVLLFAVVTLVLLAVTVPSLAINSSAAGSGLAGTGGEAAGAPRIIFRTSPQTAAFLLSSLLWIILFFSAMAGLPRVFLKEEEMRTAPALRLSARPMAVFLGKLAFNILLMSVVAFVVTPLFLVLLTPRIAEPASFFANLLTGLIGMAASATILGAIVARTGGKTYLMVPLAFPILLPLLVLAVNGSANAILGTRGNLLLPLVSYLTAMITLSVLLFEAVWRDD